MSTFFSTVNIIGTVSLHHRTSQSSSIPVQQKP